MYPGGPNPTQVQFVPPGTAFNPPLPLVLIHDGGGTTFSYFVLGSLARDVWAIHNPKFFDGLPWEGGMDEMARKYLDLIAGELSGPIMLGGWSLGGFLSLAMARVIASDPTSYSISVAGLLIIDSPYHIARSKITVPTSKAELPGLPALVEKSFDNCDDMLQDWDLPSWDSPDGGGGSTDAQFTVGGKTFSVPNGEVLRKPANCDPLDNNWETVAVKPYKRDSKSNTSGTGAAGNPPPAVLLRCIKRAKPKSNLGDRHGQSQGQGQGDGQGHDANTPGCLVDLFRHETLLGWEARYPDFIKAVIDVDADHYNLFDRTNTVGLERVTAQILKGLEILDSMHIEARKVGRVF